MASEGAQVVGVDLSTDGIETEAKMVCDVTDPAAVESALEVAVGLLEGLDIGDRGRRGGVYDRRNR